MTGMLGVTLPTVFISYAHDNSDHKSKVLDLSNRLRVEGVNASIDAYVQHPAEGWPKWMEHQFRADIVVVVMSPSRLLKKPKIELIVLLSIWDFRSSGRYPTGFHSLNRPRRRLGRSTDTLIPPAAVPAFE
jgi:hypothetical protein